MVLICITALMQTREAKAMSDYLAREFIVRETGYPGSTKQEVVGELVRCKDCKWHELEQPGMVYCPATVGGWVEDDWFCKGGERKDNA